MAFFKRCFLYPFGLLSTRGTRVPLQCFPFLFGSDLQRTDWWPRRLPPSLNVRFSGLQTEVRLIMLVVLLFPFHFMIKLFYFVYLDDMG